MRWFPPDDPAARLWLSPPACQTALSWRRRSRGQGIGEQVWTASLAQVIDDFSASGGVSADAPPVALPRVPVMISTRPSTPLYSAVPRPCFPMKPTAAVIHHDQRMVLVCQITDPLRLQIIPSMEKTPPVAISLILAPAESASFEASFPDQPCHYFCNDTVWPCRAVRRR